MAAATPAPRGERMSMMSDEFEKALETPRSKHLNLFWLALGWTAVVIGAIGAVLPILPTTPLMILAAFAFGKGSPRLRKWLLDHQFFGQAIRDWETYGAIARRYKVIACAVMALTFAASALAGVATFVLVIQAACMIPAAFYVVTRPDGPRV